MEYLASQSKFEEAPAAPNDEDVVTGEQKTFAQIVKDVSYVTIRLARQKAVELREKEREESAAKAREDRDRERKANGQRARGRQGRGESLGASGRGRGFSIPRSEPDTDWAADFHAESDQGDKPKRPAPSPSSAPPDSKAAKMTPNGSRSLTPSEPRRMPGLH
jgi:hypothetical protein